jgi:flagellar protein FlbD
VRRFFISGLVDAFKLVIIGRGVYKGVPGLILLTRLDKTRVLVCIESIKYLEANPDTLVTFLNGDTLIVRETLAEITNEVRQFKAEVAAAATKMASEK